MGTIKNKISDILFLHKIKQTDFAKKIGMDDATVSKIINGQRIPGLEIAYRISECLGFPIDRVFPYEPKGDTKPNIEADQQ